MSNSSEPLKQDINDVLVMLSKIIKDKVTELGSKHSFLLIVIDEKEDEIVMGGNTCCVPHTAQALEDCLEQLNIQTPQKMKFKEH